ncbi:endonuclease [Aequorivita sp. H23M31]|uniref:Endonuclease n=2 Tax=Aequorivita ciconiae TaxID=2494375 RepID=A0A410G7C8_9FLAO|nr:endonuclease [Aequorivita sp. H23M31]
MNKSFYLIVFILTVLFSCNPNGNRTEILGDRIIPKNLDFGHRFNDEGAEDDFDNAKTLNLVSWNIQHLGRTKTPETLSEIANILRDFDIVAIQEVVAKDPAGAQAVAMIADELNRMGFKWDYQISDPTKSPSVYISERYAFLWKTSRVSMIHRAYLDKELEDFCYREPFIASFKVKGNKEPFYVVNYHSRKYNDRPEEEIIHFLDYPQRLNSQRILIAGDFNLSEKHAVWEPFYRRGFKNAIKNERTTLKMKCENGDYLSHPIDNIYITSGITKVKANSLDFVKHCDNLEKARSISDHLPIYIEFRIEDGNESRSR